MPSASTAFGLLELRMLPKISASSFLDLTRTLTFCNARQALEALANSLETTDMHVSTAIFLLAGCISFDNVKGVVWILSQTLIERLCACNEMSEGVVQTWKTLMPLVNPMLCASMKTAGSVSAQEDCVGRWLWGSLAALVCDGKCDCSKDIDQKKVLVPPTISDRASKRLLMSYMQLCRGTVWCTCREKIASGLAYHRDDADEPFDLE